MTDFFERSLLIQAQKRNNRLQTAKTEGNFNVIATPTDFDSKTGLYIAITADGSEVQYKQGNFPQPPSTIVISNTQGSTIGFGDWN